MKPQEQEPQVTGDTGKIDDSLFPPRPACPDGIIGSVLLAPAQDRNRLKGQGFSANARDNALVLNLNY
jgi:hypothetical protein